MRCSRCDSKLIKKNKFCPECGAEVIWEEKDASQMGVQKGIRTLFVIGIILLVVIIAVAVLVAFGGASGVKNTIVGEKPTEAVAFSDDPEAIAVASQSVVKLNCYDKNGELYATGSGFACFSENVIVTNYHVIEGNVYTIKASTEDGNAFDIPYVLSTDKEKDIAILATLPYKPHGLPLLEVGNSYNLQKGEKVIAIGSPLGLLNSVSTGVFSGYTNEGGMDVLQFTAAISSGSSGGALFNDTGKVLGVTFASYESGQNLNLAIPIGYIERLYFQSDFENRQIIEEFYETNVPTYTVDQVVALGDSLRGEIFYIEGFYHTYGVSDNYAAMWLNLYSAIANDGYGGNNIRVRILPYAEMIDRKIIALKISAGLFEGFLREGELIKVRCTYEIDNVGYVLIEDLRN